MLRLTIDNGNKINCKEDLTNLEKKLMKQRKRRPLIIMIINNKKLETEKENFIVL
jgi:hypothetical protein